jgi:two-component system cell cycle response regulator DivK
MAGDREKALATGCDDFDTKPIEFDRLQNRVL